MMLTRVNIWPQIWQNMLTGHNFKYRKRMLTEVDFLVENMLTDVDPGQHHLHRPFFLQ